MSSPPAQNASQAAPLSAQMPSDTASGPGRVLEIGQILRASVLEAISSNEVRLGLLGFELIAKTKVPLLAGTELSLLVEKSGSTVLLRPLDSPQQSLQAQSDALVGPLASLPVALGKLARLLPRLEQQALLQKLPLPAALSSRLASKAPPDAETLRSFHDWFGRGFERRLAAWVREGAPEGESRADLLGSLRSYPDAMPTADPGAESSASDGQLRKALSSLANSSDAWRSEQVQRAETGAPLVFPLPIMAESFLHEGRMFLLRDPEDAGENAHDGEGGSAEGRPFTLVFLLELETLGALRVDAQMCGCDVVLGFVCALEQAAIRIHRELKGLEAEFEKKQLRLVRSTVRVQRDGVLPILDLLPPAPPGSSRLDLHL